MMQVDANIRNQGCSIEVLLAGNHSKLIHRLEHPVCPGSRVSRVPFLHARRAGATGILPRVMGRGRPLGRALSGRESAGGMAPLSRRSSGYGSGAESPRRPTCSGWPQARSRVTSPPCSASPARPADARPQPARPS